MEPQLYEQVIADFFRRKGYKATTDVSLKSPNGTAFQIDVLLEHQLPGEHALRIGVEAKLHRRALDLPTFSSIRDRFRSVGVDIGIIFTPKGLQAGAKAELDATTLPRMYLYQYDLGQTIEGSWGDDFLDAVEELRKAKEATDPDGHTTRRVVAAIEQLPHYARYFFHNLTNARWVTALAAAHVFERSAAGKNSVPAITSALFLGQHAAAHPKEFLAFVRSLAVADGFVYSTVLRAGLSLNDRDAGRLLKRIRKWDLGEIYDDEPLRDFLLRCAPHNLGEVLVVARNVAQVRVETRGQYLRDVVSNITHHVFEGLTVGFWPRLARLAPDHVSQFALARLSEVLEVKGTDIKRDFWSFELPNVGEIPTWGGAEMTIFQAARDTLDSSLDSNPQLLRPVLIDLLRSDRSSYQRLGLYLLRRHFLHFPELIAEVIAIDDFWTDVGPDEELHELVTSIWQSLDETQQSEIFRRILSPQVVDRPYRTPEDVAHLQDVQLCDWLLRLEPFGLPSHLQTRLPELQERLNMTAPLPPVRPRGGFVNDTPRESEGMEGWTTLDIIKFALTYEPISDDFLYQPSPRGLASKMSSVIAARPNQFIENWSTYRLLPHPVYFSGVLEGFQKALKEKVPLDLISAAAIASECLARFKTTETDYSFESGSAVWVRMSVAQFLEDAFEHADSQPNSDTAIPHLVSLWLEAYRTLGDQGHQSGVNSDDGEDWLTQVLNSEAGVLGLAYLRMMVATQIELGKPEITDTSKEVLLGLLTDAKARLDSEIIDSNSTLLRAPVGLFYSFLFFNDQSWATERLERIFDFNGPSPSRWQAPLECFFWSQHRYTEVFRTMRRVYVGALQWLTQYHNRTPRWYEGISHDFGLFVASGEIGPKDDLYSMFRQTATPKMKQDATFNMSRSLEVAADRGEVWQRLKAWWTACLEDEPLGLDEDRSALGAFLFWLEHVPEDITIAEIEGELSASLEVKQFFYLDYVYGFLEQRVEREANAAARLMRTMARNRMARSGQLYEERFKSLLRSAYEFGDEEARKTIRTSVDELVRAGLFFYEDTFQGDLQQPQGPTERGE
jgi:hypothetical protein